MLDFQISFLSGDQIRFTDLSDYTGLTVTATDLNVYSLPITIGEFQLVDLHSEKIAVLGDNVDIDLSLESTPISLSDGVYRFDYLVTSDENGQETVTKYFVRDIGLLECRTSLLKKIIAGDECKACEANMFDAVLNAANYEAANSNYKEAETLVNYLLKICDQCNCLQ